MKIEQLTNGYVRLTPDKGKRLYNSVTEQYYSEAIVRENKVANFSEEPFNKIAIS